ncbi:MAG: glycosyltransferase family 4 protein [Anaerolineae bacterium]|nr:glycosyltransferase family 4 protein [Anaerolineae bacterium]
MQKKNMAIIHYQVGEMDGVSLEIEKWKHVFESMGHTVTLVAGHLGSAEGIQLECLYHHTPVAERLRYNMLWERRDYPDDASFRRELEDEAQRVAQEFGTVVENHGINFLVAENIWSVLANPAVALGIGWVMEQYHLPTIAHSHDFYWEKIGDYALTGPTPIEVAQKYLPPRNPLVRHAVINQRSQRQVWERMGIPSQVVPNIFDFDEDWVVDDYNADFRASFGIRENDIVILQATRIVQRKSIELAVDFVKALNTPERRQQLVAQGLYNGKPFTAESRIILVLAGYSQDDDTGWYVKHLKQKIAESGIDALFIEDWIGGDRRQRDGHKVYSLWDSYVFADLVTYPSIWEGWGNQLLEALKARLPVVLYEYPIYEEDIKPRGFDCISLGSQLIGKDTLGLVQVPAAVIEHCADKAVMVLSDAEVRRVMVEKNHQIAKQWYSMEALHGYLVNLLAQFD